MSFLNPSAFFWTTLAVPIVVFFLLKMRTRRVSVGSVMFWQQVAEDKPPRALWLRLRHLLSLLIQLLLLLLLIFSVARPVFQGQSRQRRTIIVVLDTSASMQARPADAPQNRFNEAIGRVERLIEALSGQDEMAIVAAGRPARVLCGFTSHAGTLRQTLADVECSDAPNDLVAAVKMASQLVQSGPRTPSGTESESEPVIHVVTDGCGPQVIGTDRISVDPVGTELDNCGMTTLEVRRSFRDPLTWQTLVEIQSHSRSELAGRLEIRLNGEILDVLDVTLQDGARWSDVFEFRSAQGGVVSAVLDTADGLSVDNQAWAILPARPPVAVTLVTSGQWFLEQVLAANSLVELTVTDVMPAAPTSDITVLDGDLAMELPDGPVIVVQPNNSALLWDIDGVEESPLVGRQRDDELTKNVQLENVLLPVAARLQPLAEADVLIESADGTPLLLRFPRPEGPVIVLNVGLDNSDLPLRTAFPILLGNIISAVSEDAGELWQSVPTGQAAQLVRRSASDWPDEMLLRSDTGQTVRAVFNGKSLALPPLLQAGVYRWDGEDGQSPTPVVACQLMDVSEVNLRPSLSGGEQQSADTQPAGRPAWWYLVLAALVLAGLEWSAFHRRKLA